MRIPQQITLTASGLLTPLAMAFLQDTIRTMAPWVMAMLAVVVCDLIAGIRKSVKLGVHVSWSMAFRETMGKMVVYVAFVLMVAMIDAASGHSFNIAMWGCLFVCALEGGSVVSNLLKPYGVDITPRSIARFFAMRVGRATAEEADGLLSGGTSEEVRERERGRWERRRGRQYGAGRESNHNNNH